MPCGEPEHVEEVSVGALLVDEATALLIVMAVALVVWLGIWACLWYLHGRIRRLEREVRRREPPIA